MEKIHVDGMGMGLIFTTVSLFTEWVITYYGNAFFRPALSQEVQQI